MRCGGELDGLWATLRPRLTAIVDAAWRVAVQSDLAFPDVRGSHRSGLTAAASWYLARIHEAASVDTVVCRTFFDVANLLIPSSALTRPSILARVARQGFVRRFVTSRYCAPAACWPEDRSRHAGFP